MGDDYPDPADFMGEDYSQYENRYEDEMEMMQQIEDEAEIDFEIGSIKKKKSRRDLDTEIFSKDTKFTNIEKTAAKKRSIAETEDLGGFLESDEEILRYSSEEEDDKVEVKPESKKIKLDVNEINNNKKKTAEEQHNNDRIAKMLNQLKSSSTTTDVCDMASTVERQRVFRRPVFGEDSMNVTSFDGDRVFLRLYPQQPQHPEKNRWNSSAKEGLNLLSVPFEQLKEQVETSRRKRMDEKMQRLIERTQEGSEGEKFVKGELWVEKYSPKRYTELLSDDGTNRVLLKWLKLWDSVVFNKDENKSKKSKKSAEKLQQMKQHQQKLDNLKNGGKSTGGKFIKKFDIEDEVVMDDKGRPKHKVALLCGNPGLGKTTLAHVISRHAGYNVVEMNASDDRSSEIFLNKIESATQMKAVVGEDKRPNCLVIDEIDGAPIQAINILLEIIKNTDQGKVANKKKRKKKKDLILNRPVICICNNQFVPALRQLRQAALLLNFPPTVPARLASRLNSISQLEELRVDMGSLLMLCERTENDIRSCLNTLQFIRQKTAKVKVEDIKNMEIGQKDMKKNARTILSEIFQIPRLNKKKLLDKFQSKETGAKTGSATRFHYMLHLVSGNSDFDKIMQGLFDHYLEMRTKDLYLESVNRGCEWLGFTDVLQQHIRRNQDYVFLRYTPFLPVAFHMFFARTLHTKLPYTNVAYENLLKTQHNEQTFQLLVQGMEASIRRHCAFKVAVTELLPYLHMLTLPSLRTVNVQLYSAAEKQMFRSLIQVMISYNLNYRQERNQDGHYNYVLEPNIEELITYPDLPCRKQLPYATKQLIAREVDMERMRKAEVVTKQGPINKKAAKPSTSSAQQKVDVVKAQKLKPKTISEEKRPQLDFFGRPVKSKAPTECSTQETGLPNTKGETSAEKRKRQILSTDTMFKFHAGYTNAVRRTVKVKEFL